MANAEILIDLIGNSSEVFAAEPPNRDKLKQILSELNNFLVEAGDEYPPAVVDNIWQGAKKLRKALSSDSEINPDLLGKIFDKLTAASDALSTDKPKENIEDASAPPPEAYVIPTDDVPLIQDFIVEASEHLDASEGAMLELETHLEDTDTLNLIFRAFHTIKGMAGFMNLDQIGSLSHEAENLLDLARKGELILVSANADAIFKAIDMLKGMVDSLRTAVESDCTVKPAEGINELIQFIRTCISVPSASSADKTNKAEEQPIETITEQDKDSVQDTIPADLEEKSSPADEEPQAKKVVSPTKKTVPQKKNPASLVEEKIKVSTTRLDMLVNMVGELVIAQLMVTESLKASSRNNVDLLRNTTHQSKIIRELQELSMSMRMVPIGGVFQKMARMIRDLSRQAGKNIVFSIKGEQTELDRTIVDKLADPLIHMIRNSVDHGIEAPEERSKTSKPTAGRVELRAFHQAGSIVIEIEDDGRGLNKEKLLAKAVERGLIPPDKTPSDQEIYGIIFNPGLSTAEKVTSVSGRGVGMDVVKRNIEDLSGRIDIASALGKGTTFTITLPLTLAIIDGQVVRVGEERYIIPINSIIKSFRPTKEQISTVQGSKEMVMQRDELLPLVRLHDLFGILPDSTNPTDGLVMIVEEDNQACCLLVDDLLDQQQVVIKSLGGSIKQAMGISGGAILGDGQVRLILDIPGVIKLYRD